MKMDVSNEQGEIVELEIRQPHPTGTGLYVLTYTFPNRFVTVVTMDRHEVKAMISWLLGSL